MLIFALVALAAGPAKWAVGIDLVFAGIGTAIGIFELIVFDSRVAGLAAPTSIGIGLWLTVVGAASAFVGAVVGLAVSGRSG